MRDEKNPLVQLSRLGQSAWLDFIERKLIDSGELAALVRDDALAGLTEVTDFTTGLTAASSPIPERFRLAAAADHGFDPRVRALGFLADVYRRAKLVPQKSPFASGVAALNVLVDAVFAVAPDAFEDAAKEIRARVQGVVVWAAKNSKYQRAEAASPALDGRNLILPGYGNPEGIDYDARTPIAVQRFVDELAAFPSPRDDQVDAWSQMVNWTRRKTRSTSHGGTSWPIGGICLNAISSS